MRWRRSDGTGRGCGGGGRSRRQRRRRRFGAAMRRRGLWRRGIGTLIGDQWCRSEIEILERERGKTKGAKGRFEALLHVFDLLF